MKSIKIYLDQKDFSSIARGLFGENGFESYSRIFDLLKGLVESEEITIFFSWSHIIESLRYYDLTSQFWDIHCEVIDILTKGNCIIFPIDIEKRELELFLSNNFGFHSRFSKTNYPFGKFKDAVSIENSHNVPFEKYFEESLKKHIATLGLTRNDRRLLLKKISNKRNLKEFFKNMSDEEFGNLQKSTNDSKYPTEFIVDLSNFFDRNTFLNFIFGTPLYRSKVLNNFFDHIFHFKKLVNSYSQIFPELKLMRNFPQSTYKSLNPLIHSAQLLHDLFSKPIIDPSILSADLTNKFMKSLRPQINSFSKKYKFSRKEAENLLHESRFVPIPIIYSAILFCVEYVKKHIGSIKRGRKPCESDVIDLHNLRNIPYVDVYVTDSFFAELAGKIAKKSFGTKIFKNLFQLEAFLENSNK